MNPCAADEKTRGVDKKTRGVDPRTTGIVRFDVDVDGEPYRRQGSERLRR
ncbi:hypothetical protein ACQP1G_30845 [Nocardia sp. CA-107356]